MRTKCLILAHDFPPWGSVGGMRPWAWFRYLADFGVEPVVVTRQWKDSSAERDFMTPSESDDVEIERLEHGTLVRAPHSPTLAQRMFLSLGPDRQRTVRRSLTAVSEIGQYYADVGPRASILRAARAWLQDHSVDVILATGEPFVLFRYASLLSREFGIPWVADYRDLWSQDKRRSASRISAGWERRLERSFVATASAVTTVSETLRDALTRLLPDTRIEVSPNGYDPEAMASAREVPQARHALTLGFVGTVYPWHPIEGFLGVCEDFVRDSATGDLALLMIGVSGPEDVEVVIRDRFPALAPHVTFRPRLANDRMAVELARSNALVMFNNYAYPGTKIFDYLALARTVLLCYADDPEANALKQAHYNLDITPGMDEGVLERLIEDTRSGIVVRDRDHLATVLRDLSRELGERGEVACDPVGVERFSRRAETGRLAEILREVTG